MVHGLADDARSFVLPAAELSLHFRCISYNLPDGRGDGARLGRYRHDDLVADLFSLAEHLGVERAYLFGSSFGSTVALKAMYDAPGRFPRAVLQGGFACRRLSPAEVSLARVLRHIPLSAFWMPFRRAMVRHEYGAPFAGRGDDVWEYFVQRCSSPPMSAMAQRGLMLRNLDLRPLLPEIHQPILLICGEYDPLVSKDCERELLEHLPNAARLAIEGCGHHPYFTHPEVMAEVIHRFLTPLACQLHD
jgi:pimeloyl-ACP methyl ester carboxylesterase